MQKLFQEDFNPRYNPSRPWSMTQMRATTAAYAEVAYFGKGKVPGSGGSKRAISPAVALINDQEPGAIYRDPFQSGVCLGSADF